MPEFFVEGGYVMWAILVVGLVMLGLAADAARKLVRADAAAARRVGTQVDAVLFWGIFGVVMGLLGTFVGLSQAARAISMSGQISTALAWGAVRIALTPTIFGLVLLGVALAAWFPLRVLNHRAARMPGAVAAQS